MSTCRLPMPAEHACSAADQARNLRCISIKHMALLAPLPGGLKKHGALCFGVHEIREPPQGPRRPVGTHCLAGLQAACYHYMYLYIVHNDILALLQTLEAHTWRLRAMCTKYGTLQARGWRRFWGSARKRARWYGAGAKYHSGNGPASCLLHGSGSYLAS